MPPRRRHNPSAAKLPASRLPLGTHLPGDDHHSLRPISRNTDHSIASPPPATAASDSDTATHIDIKHHPAYKAADISAIPDEIMDSPPGNTSEATQPAYSMAEAKLRRQQERIQNAEAALNAPHHLDRREPSRGKSKPSWKPLDIEWDTAERAKNEPAPVPVQTRTNTIYGPAFSRDTSMSRSLSSVSHQTAATDAERHDSIADTAGFQTYYGRRGRKPTEELGATEEFKRPERQATVEGSYDKREMCKVFGGELPGIDFMASNCGFKDGQLQFVQHPNGDVSAHMWSHHRYMWENIGNFSNIRKRIEGQLASDRLKGETGWQTLQKNTLAYFRAIAKQREQNAMGEEFGQAEIQQILPQPPKETAKPPQPSHTASPATSGSSRKPPAALPPLFNAGQHSSIPAATQRPAAPPTRRNIVGQGFPFLPIEPSAGKEDPFSGAGIFLPTKEPPQAKVTLASARLSKPTIESDESPLNPFLLLDTQRASGVDAALSQQSPARPKRDVAPAASGLSDLFPLDLSKLGPKDIGQQNQRRQESLDSAGTPSCSKNAVTPESRQAMREKLWKVSEFAKKRTDSQTNIRTVLHDPFQNKPAKTEQPRMESLRKETPRRQPRKDADVRSESDGPQLFVPRVRTKAVQPSYRTWTDSQPALNGNKAITLTRQEEPESLADSVPDIDDYDLVQPSPSMSLGTTHVADDRGFSAITLTENYDEELKEWWTSGANVSRQEELYQRIKTLEMSKATVRTRTPAYTTTTPTVRPRPIGANRAGGHSASSTASPQKPIEPPFNKAITRALVPVYENLASYVQGPMDQRRDYWSNWRKPEEWCIDRSPNGNKSFFDDGWGQPPARIGRDPRYRALPNEMRFSGIGTGSMGGNPRANGMHGIPGLRGSMGFGGGGRF